MMYKKLLVLSIAASVWHLASAQQTSSIQQQEVLTALAKINRDQFDANFAQNISKVSYLIDTVNRNAQFNFPINLTPIINFLENNMPAIEEAFHHALKNAANQLPLKKMQVPYGSQALDALKIAYEKAALLKKIAQQLAIIKPYADLNQYADFFYTQGQRIASDENVRAMMPELQGAVNFLGQLSSMEELSRPKNGFVSFRANFIPNLMAALANASALAVYINPSLSPEVQNALKAIQTNAIEINNSVTQANQAINNALQNIRQSFSEEEKSYWQNELYNLRSQQEKEEEDFFLNYGARTFFTPADKAIIQQKASEYGASQSFQQLLQRTQGAFSINLYLTSTSGVDILVDADCRTSQGDPYSLSARSPITLPITLAPGTVCKVYAIDKANVLSPRQAVLCLDSNGNEVPNCEKKCICVDKDCLRKICPRLDCTEEGSCSNVGFKWVRGQLKFLDARPSTPTLFYGLVGQ